jgi:UDP-N-acetyl-D-galactosamine dehydrogenase
VYVHDPLADPADARHEYGLELTAWESLPRAPAIVAAVSHREFAQRTVGELAEKLAPSGVYIDVKSQCDAKALRARGIDVWRL